MPTLVESFPLSGLDWIWYPFLLWEYKIGILNGRMYAALSDVSIKPFHMRI